METEMWILTCLHVTSIRSLSVLTIHALVRHTNPTQRDYVKPEAVFLVFISDTGENPPRIQIGRWERQVFEIDFQTVGIWKI